MVNLGVLLSTPHLPLLGNPLINQETHPRNMGTSCSNCDEPNVGFLITSTEIIKI